MASNTHSSRSKPSELPWLASAAAMAAVCGLAALASAAAPAAGVSPVSDQPAWQFLAAFAAGTIIVMLLLRSQRASRFFATFFLIAVASGAGYLGLALAGPDMAVLLFSVAVLARLAWPIVAVHDLTLVVGLAGVGADLGGVIRPVGVLAILAILSFYDIIAVYGSKHMVKMASSLLRHKAFFAMILPASAGGYAARLDKVERGGGFTFLGTGDLALPAMLAASAARQGTAFAVATALGATVGVAALGLIFMGKGKGRPMPALPPIAAGAIAGYGLALLFH